MNENEVENELKHWGILDMHWGVRRFQNPDGSLTPAGRERYLKNIKKQKGLIEKANIKKSVSVHDIPDEELKQITNRLYLEMNFIRARNQYIESEIRYGELTKEPKKFQSVSRFMKNVFGKSIENVLQQDVEFALKMQGANILDQMGSDYTKDYLDYVLKRNNKPKKNNNNNKSYNRNDNNDNDDDDDD